jgi:hypothetical protein
MPYRAPKQNLGKENKSYAGLVEQLQGGHIRPLLQSQPAKVEGRLLSPGKPALVASNRT